jgi:hypothetical protein
VLSYYLDDYRGLSKEDVSVIWWKYFFFFYGTEDARYQNISKLLAGKLENDTKGPSFRAEKDPPTEFPIFKRGCKVLETIELDQEYFAERPPEDSCRNYTRAQIESALAAAWDANDAEVPLNMSQVTHLDRASAEFDSMIDFDVEEEVAPLQDSNKESAHSILNPTLKELLPYADANPELLQKVKRCLDTFLQEEKYRLAPEASKGNVVSSHQGISKKQKTHGVQHMHY